MLRIIVSIILVILIATCLVFSSPLQASNIEIQGGYSD